MPSDSLPEPNPESPLPQHQVRLGVTNDAPSVDAWLQAIQPLPVPGARSRRLVLEGLLAQSGQGACLLVETSKSDETAMIAACLPVALVPSLSLGGLVACATEWWTASAEAGQGDAWISACCNVLAEWCRAHGIRHILLAPRLPRGGPPAGFALQASGFWLRSLVPAAKALG